MRIVLGIGNPGEKYEATRHNAGFLVIDALCEKQGKGYRKLGFEFEGAEVRLGDGKALLVRPWTYVNAVGRVIPELRKRFEELGENFLVVCDDIALPFGGLRLRPGGTSGGHNGLKSIIEALGTDQFARLRLGVGAPAGDAADHVLAKFGREERKLLPALLADAVAAVEYWADEGIEKAMTRFNRTPKPEGDEKTRT